MANIICYHEDRYNLYSTIADGFLFEASLSIDQLKQTIKDSNGDAGLEALPDRLIRAHQNGHSSLVDKGDLNAFLCCNRAGEGESFLATDECISRFLS